jgi:hypothetical protein
MLRDIEAVLILLVFLRTPNGTNYGRFIYHDGVLTGTASAELTRGSNGSLTIENNPEKENSANIIPPGSAADVNVDFRACHQSWVQYSNRAEDWSSSYQKELAPTVGVYSNTYTQTIGDGVTYTACDGITRIASFTSTGTTQTVVTFTTPEERTGESYEEAKFYSAPTPACAIDAPGCTQLFNSYTLNGAFTSMDPEYPHCTHVPVASPACTVTAENMVVMYWPDHYTSKDACGENGRVVPYTQALSNTAPFVFSTDAITFRVTRVAARGDVMPKEHFSTSAGTLIWFSR